MQIFNAFSQIQKDRKHKLLVRYLCHIIVTNTDQDMISWISVIWHLPYNASLVYFTYKDCSEIINRSL